MVRISTARAVEPRKPPQPGGDIRPVVMIFVCTANQCRSPLAEHIARRESARLGVATRVTSMGFLPGGSPTPVVGIRAAAEHGLDLRGHRSQSLDPKQLDEADLILTMTHSHARELLADAPGLWPRVFPLKQFVAYAAAYPPPHRGWFHSWIAVSSDLRRHSDLLGDNPIDGVADPLGQPIAIWRRTIDELNNLITRAFSSCSVALPQLGG